MLSNFKKLLAKMEEFEWNAVNESKLLEAMVGHKPIGINKYFEMACICEKLNEISNFDISSDKIWTHLRTMYNLEALDETETIPFPNDEKDFILPEQEFGVLKIKKEEKVEEKNGKSTTNKRNDNVKSANTKDGKRDDKHKKDIQRRDSKDGKDNKSHVIKKDTKKEINEKTKNFKSRNSSHFKEDEKSKNKSEEKRLQQVKRPTRASIKPDESRKSQSPLTVNPSSATKRRRI